MPYSPVDGGVMHSVFEHKFRDSLAEMDSRFRGNDVISARHVTFTLAVAVWSSFPRKRESIA